MIDKSSWSHEPIKVIKLKTKNKTPALGQPFGEDDDWLRGFTITVENIADKAIARIEFNLAFPGTKTDWALTNIRFTNFP